MKALPTVAPSRKQGRRVVVTAIALTLAVSGVFSAGGTGTTAANAITSDLPTWDDVQKAKRNQAAADAKISEIQTLIKQVQAEVVQTRKAAEEAAEKALLAEAELDKAQERLSTLETQEKASKKQAEAAAKQAAALVSQFYRSGGIDHTLDLFLEADESTADALLDRLASMEKATERNTAISEEAEQAMNSAKTLGDQAESARDERDKLRKEAVAESEAAAAAAAASAAKLAEQEAQEETLQAQLAALKDKTADTVAGYKQRLKEEEAERKRLEEEARKKGNSSTKPSKSGWVKPLSCCYWVSAEWWGYYGHHGIDLAIGSGTPIYAAKNGTVSMAGWYGAYGNAVFINHAGGITTRYGHMVRTPSVSYGEKVSAGQLIGYVGSTGYSTGPHLHFETLVDGVRTNPRPFMAARGVYF